MRAYIVFLTLIAIGVACIVPDCSEIERRQREIARLQGIIKQARQKPLNPAPLRELVGYANHPDSWDRAQMFAQMKGLGRLFRETRGAGTVFEDILLPTIRRGLADPSPYVRREAALAANEFGSLSKGAIPELIQTVEKFPNEDAAWFAAEALGAIGPAAADAIPALEAAAKNPSFEQEYASRAIRKIRAAGNQ